MTATTGKTNVRACQAGPRTARNFPRYRPDRPLTYFNAIQVIGGTIAEIDNISSEIATAVDQQGEATREIAGNVQQASNSTQDVNKSILRVGRASDEADKAASRLLEAANGLSSQSERLKAEVDHFLGSLRVA
jgi:methyl-accepting chemotaxis protein